jgi:hypothetical protein
VRQVYRSERRTCSGSSSEGSLGTEDLATVKTADDGKFVSGELKSGSYEVNAQAGGFKIFRSPIVVASPAKKCRHGVIIVLVLAYPTIAGALW